MPTPGDADTFGCSELFGGRVASTEVMRGEIVFTVNSFLDVVNQDVPSNVIELTNTLAAYRAATPPAGYSQVPQFTVVSASTKVVTGRCTLPADEVFAPNAFQFGYLVFNDGTSATLGRVWSAVESNYASGLDNVFVLFSPLPWAPTPNTDTFYVSAAFPLNKDDGQYAGFPYVPSPETAL
jgi:hypothetical protein